MPTISELAARGASLLAKVRKDPGDAESRAALDAIANEIEAGWGCADVDVKYLTRADIAAAKLDDFEGLTQLKVRGTKGHVSIRPGWGHLLVSHVLDRGLA